VCGWGGGYCRMTSARTRFKGTKKEPSVPKVLCYIQLSLTHTHTLNIIFHSPHQNLIISLGLMHYQGLQILILPMCFVRNF